MRRSRGFTLLEVLLAILIVSFALLGLARLQTFGLKHTGNSYFRTQATTLLNDMAERTRLNPYSDYQHLAADSCINRTWPKSCRVSDIDESGCDADELALFDIYEVACGVVGTTDGLNLQGVDELLPNGRLHINCPANELCQLAVYWDESVIDPNADHSGARSQLVSSEFFR